MNKPTNESMKISKPATKQANMQATKQARTQTSSKHARNQASKLNGLALHYSCDSYCISISLIVSHH